jgi:ABC-2 type transport system ATP-binding protein
MPTQFPMLLEVKNLTKAYGVQKVVNAISFSVTEGEIFGILGPNGAGKTTTLEMIEALRPIDGGSVTLDGVDVAREPNQIKRMVGVQLQATAYFDNLTLTELLTMFGGLYGCKVNAQQLLDDVQLGDRAKSFVANLSGGQKQRFSIASALVNSPRILILDEPTTGLDPQSRRNLWELIQKLRDNGLTIMLTTHYMDEAELLCDRVAVMDAGRIIALDTPKNLVTNLLGRGFTKDARIQQATLEDVFIDLIGREPRI